VEDGRAATVLKRRALHETGWTGGRDHRAGASVRSARIPAEAPEVRCETLRPCGGRPRNYSFVEMLR
jgi:hypothetical protein